MTKNIIKYLKMKKEILDKNKTKVKPKVHHNNAKQKIQMNHNLIMNIAIVNIQKINKEVIQELKKENKKKEPTKINNSILNLINIQIV